MKRQSTGSGGYIDKTYMTKNLYPDYTKELSKSIVRGEKKKTIKPRVKI